MQTNNSSHMEAKLLRVSQLAESATAFRSGATNLNLPHSIGTVVQLQLAQTAGLSGEETKRNL